MDIFSNFEEFRRVVSQCQSIDWSLLRRPERVIDDRLLTYWAFAVKSDGAGQILLMAVEDNVPPEDLNLHLLMGNLSLTEYCHKVDLPHTEDNWPGVPYNVAIRGLALASAHVSTANELRC